jgi:hypothetical protein
MSWWELGSGEWSSPSPCQGEELKAEEEARAESSDQVDPLAHDSLKFSCQNETNCSFKSPTREMLIKPFLLKSGEGGARH